VLIDSAGVPEVIVIATGSEVGIAADAVRTMAAKGKKVRLVSMPSTNTSTRRKMPTSKACCRVGDPPRGGRGRRCRVLVALCGVKRRDRRHQSLRRIGAGKDLFKAYGFTAEHVAAAIERVSSK